MKQHNIENAFRLRDLTYCYRYAKPLQKYFLLFSLLLINSCIVQFIPETSDNQELLVVEGLLTNEAEPCTIKLSKSLPLGGVNSAQPYQGCNVAISDDIGNNYNLYEAVAGTYITSGNFQGIIGRKYTLHISINEPGSSYNFESIPMEMKAVPPIDSVYYEKTVIEQNSVASVLINGCQIYLDTHDPDNVCKYFRWEFSETWEFKLPYYVPNKVCWISSSSDKITIKNTSSLSEVNISRYPVNFISNRTDRLREKYSILVYQYSLNEDEYVYWEKLRNVAENVGGLYDVTPASIPSNVYCIEDPGQKVLGYFSVSAVSSKRIFIKDQFSGLVDLYAECSQDTLFNNEPIPGLGNTVWVIVVHTLPPPAYRVITYTEGCYDCSVRGTPIKPTFWSDEK